MFLRGGEDDDRFTVTEYHLQDSAQRVVVGGGTGVHDYFGQQQHFWKEVDQRAHHGEGQSEIPTACNNRSNAQCRGGGGGVVSSATQRWQSVSPTGTSLENKLLKNL